MAGAGAVQFAPQRLASIRARSWRRSRLDIATLRRSEDSFVDELVAGVVEHGYPLMRAHFPRCFVDVNREPYELDPRMFEGRLPSFANTRSMRVAGGLGTVARVVGDAQEIYDQRISVDDALRAHREPVQALSPRAAAAVHPRAPRFRRRHADRLPFDAVDDRPQGRAAARRNSCWATATAPVASAVSETVEKTLRALGYTVSRNKPYAGGFITEHYGNPAAGLHAIQLEINRALYMDERRYRAHRRLRPAGRRHGDAGRPAGRNPAGRAAPLSRGGRIASCPAIAAGARRPKKRAARVCKRPKSREETPKEGSGISTALQ